MTKAYDEIHLGDAMKNLAECFDYAVNVCGISADDFMNMFIVSGVADNFEKGNPKYLCGKSGSELALEILNSSGLNITNPVSQTEYDCTPEYWAGWILAYYQWKSGKPFRAIRNVITLEAILKMYPTFHEASEDKFSDTIDSIFSKANEHSRLQQQRKLCGYSQRELSEKSGVNLRTLQQYESGSKDIGKASVSTVISLAGALDCSIEAILQ